MNPSVKFEIAVIGVPLFFFLLWFVQGFKDYVWYTTPPKNTMDVYVMGKKWMWKFAYPGGGPNAIGTLHVPAGRPVRLLMTSRDVIHSFFVPDFRIKQDVLPGRYTETWFEATKPGRYQVCAPSTAAPGTRRCGARSWSCRGPNSTSGCRRSGRGSPSGSTPAATTAAAFRGSIVEYGKKIAMAAGVREVPLARR